MQHFEGEGNCHPHVAASAILAVCAAMLYACTSGYEYVWDDLTYLGEFLHYRGLAGAIRAVSEPFYLYPSYYRPLVMLSFVVSAEPWVQHGINVVLHALNVVLVFWCARALMPREVAESRTGVVSAALGALMFAVHPVCVEPVAWVSGRFDTLMSSFVLGTSLVVLDGELTRRRQVVAFVLFFAAMCCKESAVGLPVALPLLLLLKWRLGGEEAGLREMVRRLVPLLAVLALAVALYIAVRLAVVQALFADKATFSGGSLLDKLNIAALAVAAFAKLLVNPWSHSAPLHPFTYEVGSGVLANTLVVFGCVLALFAGAALKKPRLNFPLALLAALAMVSPALHLVSFPNVGVIISDRYALAPLALLLAALSAAIGAWLARRMSAMGAGERRVLVYAGVFVLLWAGALAAHTHVTIPMWRNEYVLWGVAHRQVPDSDWARKKYIEALLAANLLHEANAEVERLRAKGGFENLELETLINLMVLRANAGDYQGALDLFVQVDEGELAAAHPREQGIFYGARGMIECNAEHWELALEYLEKAVQISPENQRISFWYAHALFMNGQQEKAEEVFGRALAGSTGGLTAWAVEWRKTWGKK